MINGERLVDVEWCRRRERERQHEPIHENVNPDSIKQSRHHGVLCQRTQFPAGGVKHRCGRKRDQEVNARDPAPPLPFLLRRIAAQQTARDPLQPANGPTPLDPRDHKRGGDIEDSGDQTSQCDCRKSPRVFSSKSELLGKQKIRKQRNNRARMTIMQICKRILDS